MVDVIDTYDGPRLFVATNALQAHFLVLWADQDEDNDYWVYLPITEYRLDELYASAMSIRDAYLAAEEKFVYFVTESLNKHDSFDVKLLSVADLDQEYLPPPDDFLETRERFSAMETAVDADDDLPCVHRVSVNLRKKVDFARVSHLVAAWTNSISALAQEPFVPVSASVGSFVVDLGSKDEAKVAAYFQLVDAYLNDREEIQVDSPQHVEMLRFLVRMLNEIVSSRLTLKASIISDGGNSPGILLTRDRVQRLLVRLERRLSVTLTSADVPQADDIQRLFRLVELINATNQAGSAELEVTPRQVSYYKHAARILRFLDDDNFVTSHGRHLVSLGNEDRLAVARIAFEGSAVGFAWLTWANARTSDDLDPSTAFQFLSETVVNLSEDTRRRRALTLRSWIRSFS